MQQLRQERHSFSALIVHLVCVTRYRHRLFDDPAIEWLRGHCEKVCGKLNCRLMALDGEADHIHLLVEYPPKLAISVLVNALKGTSSRLLRKERPDIASQYWEGALWSPSYFAASAGGATLEKVKQYVDSQRCSNSP